MTALMLMPWSRVPGRTRSAACRCSAGTPIPAVALFEKLEVLGVQSVMIHPTPEADAHGWSDAFGTRRCY